MALNSTRSAIVIPKAAGTWINRHQNVEQAIDGLFDVWNPPAPNDDVLADLRLTVAALQGIVANAISDNVRLRAVGGGWSLSDAAVTNGRLINTRPLNWYFPLAPSGVRSDYSGDPSLLMYLQCGVSVEETNDLLFAQPRQLALKTSGASNGQTIVGAVSTGTHGSRFRFGAMPDYVMGIHLITGANRVIWLERASAPVLSDDLAAKLGAQVVRDDTLFNSALVSFGSFGIVFGLLIETEPLYLLEVWRKRLPIDDNLRQAMATMSFGNIPTPYPAEDPLHFEVMVNPHDVAGGAYVTTMYKRQYAAGYTPPSQSPGGLGPGDDLLSVIGKIGDALPFIVGPVVNAVVSREYRLFGPETGTPGEIFDSNTTLQKEMSAEIGVQMEDSARALDLMLALPQVTGFPGLLAFRWVKQSKALLAFTKFPTTCTIELPAAYATGTTDFYQSVWQGLEEAGIPYTLHWGQMNNFTPARVRAMYGAAVDDWIASRRGLLDAQAQSVFTSPFIEQCGLA